MQTTTQPVPVEQNNGPPIIVPPVSAPAPNVENAPQAPLWQRIVSGIIVFAILATFCSYVLGVQFPGLYAHGNSQASNEDKDNHPSALPGVSLVSGKAHTLEVPEDVRRALGIRKGNQELVATVRAPELMRPLVMTGSLALDPTRLARIRARFAPARVAQIGQAQEFSPKMQRTVSRELGMGDRVNKGDILGVFYSVDVGSKKNDLLDALVQLQLDQEILDDAEKHREAIPKVFYISQVRAVQGDRNAVNRALNNLKVWDIPQDEIDALHEEAQKMAADKNAWFKTPEGRWVRGEKADHGPSGKEAYQQDNDLDRWARVTLRAPFDGVIVERNLHLGEMIVDQTVNLFQIADVSRMLVIANGPEDQLPTLKVLDPSERSWTIRAVGITAADGLPGPIEQIGWLIDPNQHTLVVEGYVDNPGQILRAGQTVSATVRIPPPAGVVEVPINALVDDGKQSLVFVQTDPAKPQYTMRRVEVTHRFDQRVFVRSTPIPKEEQRTAQEAEEGLLPKEPLRPGERVLQTGAGELKAALLSLESLAKKQRPSE
jgi:cobalt-zinc-cadmium efflux system membrane fusion protein